MDTYTKRERTIYLLGMLGQNLIYGVIGTGLTYYFSKCDLFACTGHQHHHPAI